MDSPWAKSLASSLASEEEVTSRENNFSFMLNELRAKDARAMWNTRMRSLVIANNVIQVINSSSNNE
ncbi:hypothetical protein OAO34_05115 [Candidatus Poseidoniaceae archaeon]|nr:hypothetical protein [Candidatus Poseidoniaceae archaeon]